MKSPCPRCHRETAHNTWAMNGHSYSECGRCGAAIEIQFAPVAGL